MLTQLAAAAASDEHLTGTDAIVMLGGMALTAWLFWLATRD